MSVAELKKTKSNLIAWIEELSDSNMLTFLDSIRSSKSDKDWWEQLTEAQRENINEGVKDAENGRVISSAEFWTKLKNG
jgi:predicted transcriptional regulator